MIYVVVLDCGLVFIVTLGCLGLMFLVGVIQIL